MGNICLRLWEYLKPCLPCVVQEAGKQVDNENTGGSCSSGTPWHQGHYFVALFDYQARTAEDLSFHAGDKLQVLDNSHEGWWFARHLGKRGVGPGQQLEGYIPSNYVAEDRSLQAEPWFFGAIKRADAEKQLLYSENQTGAFLIRESESDKGNFALSVLVDRAVKHYKIRRLDEGGFFLTRKRTFTTLNEFVDYYTQTSGGLCVKLGKPCLKIQIPAPFDLSYKTADQWEIDRNSVQLLKRLGSGQFGEVWEGLWNNTTPVAVKTLKPGSMDPNDFLREAQIMKNLRHPKLIQLYAVCTLEDPIYIITELMRHGSLQEYLQNDAGLKIQLTQQVDMAAQVASGMAYLESQNYIHRDLAARNVLVGEHNIYKVADFGLARVFKVDNEDIYESRHEIKLPVKWTAPEAIRANKFSIKSDVWSFGILLYEIITYGKIPYSGMTGAQVIQMLSQNYRLPQPSNCPQQFYNIMLECWNAEPKERPKFETLYWKLEGYFETDSFYSDADDFIG
ncbi:tyrosine-protein kinase FRK [Molossus molossus]|uniref:Tyrosine-protein kinase n=1 Tax=Molossus molossus TaxID=27622 RepID=A0A7J8GPE0_MOLMO|nr:tyrosine-protein kinase FRK [Molossus molossus]KAF6461913.1 fyn related Src family tyrosine kinase [Molossus molossus]